MKTEKLAQIYKLAKRVYKGRPSTAQCRDLFKRKFPEETRLFAGAAIDRQLDKQFRDFFHSVGGFHPDDPKSARQYSFALAGMSPPVALVIRGEERGSFVSVQFEEVTRDDFEKWLLYMEEMNGHLFNKIRDGRLKYHQLMGFQSWANEGATVAEVLKPVGDVKAS